MNECLHTINIEKLNLLQNHAKHQAINSLESGKILYFPNTLFSLKSEEDFLLTDSILNPRNKNISYDYTNKKLSGLKKNFSPTLYLNLQKLMHRYALFSKDLINNVLPKYSKDLQWGRTSYRPAQIKGRSYSKCKDDTLLHVDSFSATPVNGLRILRLFCNINPYGEPRVWNIGEDFSKVISTFSSFIPSYSLTKAKFLKIIKATKSLRSPYDHYMLHLHNKMKLDDDYQKNVNKKYVEFPPLSNWLVFTDTVSHAALSGQFVLEQTFYLPEKAMVDPALSPKKQLEKNNHLSTS